MSQDIKQNLSEQIQQLVIAINQRIETLKTTDPVLVSLIGQVTGLNYSLQLLENAEKKEKDGN